MLHVSTACRYHSTSFGWKGKLIKCIIFVSFYRTRAIVFGRLAHIYQTLFSILSSGACSSAPVPLWKCPALKVGLASCAAEKVEVFVPSNRGIIGHWGRGGFWVSRFLFLGLVWWRTKNSLKFDQEGRTLAVLFQPPQTDKITYGALCSDTNGY